MQTEFQTRQSSSSDLRIGRYQSRAQDHGNGYDPELAQQKNVAASERLVSLASGALLAVSGLARRDGRGLVAAGIGGALLHRGFSGYCPVYEAVGMDTAHQTDLRDLDRHGVEVSECFLIARPRPELYSWWRDFERLPSFMSHLHSVKVHEDGHSDWVADFQAMGQHKVTWQAEMTADEANRRIEWETLQGSEVQHRGAVLFTDAPGDRGTQVSVMLQYLPPAGQFGRWAAWLFGEEPQQQLRNDLRNFKRLMETGEIPTTAGQPHGHCYGFARLFHS